MHRLLNKAVAAGFLLLLMLWITGLFRTAVPPAATPMQGAYPLTLGNRDAKQGQMLIANNLRTIGLERTPLPALLDRAEVDKIHIHEKLAWLTSQTADFDSDEKRVRASVTDYKATIFNEWAEGVNGQRRVTLAIGVNPDLFDSLVSELRKVGKLESVSVQHRDRTSEFRDRHSQRQALKKHLEDIEKLRRVRPASIDDELKVENKMQEIQKELRKLSGELGELLGKESYYHVNLTLVEYHPASALDVADTIPRHMGRALVWAIPWWFAVAVVLGIVPCVYFSVRELRARSDS